MISFFHWLLSVAFLSGAYVWLKRQTPEHALLLTVLSAINVSVMFYFRRTLSEAAFMPLLMWSAVWMDRALDNAQRPRGLQYALLATPAAAYLCTVRLAGAALVCGFALMLVYRLYAREITSTRAVVYALFAAALPLAAALSLVFYDRSLSAASSQSTSYYDELTRHPLPLYEQIFTGIRLRIQEIGRLLIPGAFKVYGGWLNPMMLVYLPFAAAILIGGYREMRARPTVLLLALPFYCGLYVIWPHDQGTRFMTPMVPVLWLCLATFALTSRWRAQARRVFPWLILATAVTSLVYLVGDRLDERKLAPYWRLTDIMATIIPVPAHIGFIRTSSSFSANSFAPICTVKFDRRCNEIPDRTTLAAPPEVQYIAVLGPYLDLPGFAPVLKREQLTVLRRLPPIDR